MKTELLLLIGISFSLGFTPGPNNAVASYSGFNFGNKKAFEAVRGRKISDANVSWKGQEFELDKSWLFEGKDKEISHFVDLARRLAPKLSDNPNNILTMEPQMFDLGPFRDRLRNIMSCVRNGPGVALYRGLPTQDLSLLEIALIISTTVKPFFGSSFVPQNDSK